VTEETRVQVVGPYGEQGTVPISELDNVVKSGGRPATDQEIAQARVDEAYAKKSTAEKALGIANTVVGSLAGPLAMGHDPNAPPEIASYGAGVRQGMTAGTYDGLVRQALTSLVGPKAGATYEQQTNDLRTGYSGSHAVGELAGMFGGAALGNESGLARMLPSAGIGAVGSAVEQGVARALASTAARGVAGRALASGAALGAQGLLEGALYGAGQQFGEDMLGDHDVAADRIFTATGMGALYGALGGATLGGAGSLAKSGAKAALESIGSGIGRMAGGETQVARAAEEGATGAPAKGNSFLAKAAETDTQKAWAYDQAFRAMGGGMGFSPTRPIKQAARYLPNGTTDLGEIAMRHGIIDATADPLSAAMNGKPAEMIPKAQAAEAAVGQRIGDLTAASGATVSGSEIQRVIDSVAKPYEQRAGFRHVGESVRNYGDELKQVLGLGPGGQGDVSVQALLEQRKALDQLAYQESKALDPKMRVQALRDVRSGLEDVITDSMDAASGKASGELRTEYKTLKKDFMGLRMINEILEDSAARQQKAATFPLTSILTGAATGGLGTGLATAVGTKLIKERGNAAAAVLLYRMAESGAITRAIQQVDAQLGRSAKGLLNPPASPPSSAPARNPIAVAQRAQAQVVNLTSSPNAVASRAATVTQGLSNVAPNVAGKVATNMTRALAFLNSKLPPVRNIDPLAPQQKRSWSQTEAERFSRYVDAAEDPMGTLHDIEHGKVTPEAVETLRVLTPTLYRDLQDRTLDAIADQLATGKQVPFETRLKLGTLLGIQADPSLNPRVQTWLQGNISAASGPASGNMQPAHPGPAQRPIQLQTQHSAFDRLAENGPGRR
jgi:hypothetical protein